MQTKTLPFGKLIFGTDLMKELSDEFLNFEQGLKNYTKDVAKNFGLFIEDSIKKTENGYDLELILPGYSKNDIEIKADEKELIISSEIKEEGRKKSFVKRYNLNGNYDIENIKSKLTDGILTINLTKKEKEANKKTITID